MILQAALSSELAIIQGPPGTGKSYVGVQIVRALLANTTPTAPPTTQQLRRGPRDPTPQTAIGPIWVVCLTNHALDQFLEDLLVTSTPNNLPMMLLYNNHYIIIGIMFLVVVVQ